MESKGIRRPVDLCAEYNGIDRGGGGTYEGRGMAD